MHRIEPIEHALDKAEVRTRRNRKESADFFAVVACKRKAFGLEADNIHARIQVRLIHSHRDTVLQILKQDRCQLRDSRILGWFLALGKFLERSRMTVARKDNLFAIIAQAINHFGKNFLAVNRTLEQLNVINKQDIAFRIKLSEIFLALGLFIPLFCLSRLNDRHRIAHEIVCLAVYDPEFRPFRTEFRRNSMEQVGLAEAGGPVNKKRVHRTVARFLDNGDARLVRQGVARTLYKVFERIFRVHRRAQNGLLLGPLYLCGLPYSLLHHIWRRIRKLHLGNRRRHLAQAYTVIYKRAPDNGSECLAQKFTIMTVEPCFAELVRNGKPCDSVVHSFELDRFEELHSKSIEFSLGHHIVLHGLPGRSRQIQ